jgi:hypothetical protein
MPRRPEHQRVRFDPSAVEIVPLTLDRWDDVAALFGEGGDPKSCWCMFWRVHSKEWSFANPTESREGLHALVHDARDPAPGLLAYEDGRPVGWVSVGPRADYRRLVHSRVRPAADRIPAAVGYTGLLSTFEAAGFEVVREIDSPGATVQRVIVRRDA